MVLIMCEGNNSLDMQTCEKVRYELQYPRLIRIHPIELLIQTLEPTRQCAPRTIAIYGIVNALGWRSASG